MGLPETARKYQREKDYATRKNLKFNRNTDADILYILDLKAEEHSKDPSKESMQGYIKRLIREDIERMKKTEGAEESI